MKFSFSDCHVMCEGLMRCYGRGKDECCNYYNDFECVKDNPDFKGGKSFMLYFSGERKKANLIIQHDIM